VALASGPTPAEDTAVTGPVVPLLPLGVAEASTVAVGTAVVVATLVAAATSRAGVATAAALGGCVAACAIEA
jgi:hypothetical protein